MCTLEKRGNLFILTFTGDGTHSFNPTVIDSIRTALKQVRTEAKPGSALVTTAQGKFFSNGLDLIWSKAAGPTEFNGRVLGLVHSFKLIVSDLFSLPIPTIAAVTGHAAAAGFMLALSHDYVLMNKNRGVLYMSELDIGLPFPDYFMALTRSKITSPIGRRDVGLGAAKINAERAVELGFIDSAHDSAEDTIEAALRLGEKLAARNWNGEVYVDIRKATFPEVCETVGLNEKSMYAQLARL